MEYNLHAMIVGVLSIIGFYLNHEHLIRFYAIVFLRRSMKRNAFKILFGALLLVLGVSACNFPASITPTPFVFPTPNLTMTAVFNPTQIIPPSPTPLVLATGTVPSPTNTNPPPTEGPTAAPTATPTVAATTAVPTNTSAPATATQPPPDSRPRYQVKAFYVDDPIEIDGIMDDWDLTRYDVESVVFGADRWDDEDDLSATAMFAWDENNLYIATRVRDEEYVQNARTRELFMGDSLEILIDTNLQADYFTRSLSADDFQLGISPGSPGPGDDPEAYLWFPTSIEGRRTEVDLGAESVADGYYVEAAIPWDVFEMDPDEGQHYGFAFSVSDNDRESENVQQSMVSNVGTRSLTDPTTWGDLELVD
jgi:hypothetical protein